MNNKKNLIQITTTLLFAFMLVLSTYSQVEEAKISKENKDKIKAQKVAFITDKLDLSPKEAKKFWPVYEEHETLVKEENENFRKTHDLKPENIEILKKEDAEKLLNDHLAHEQKLLDLRKQFSINLSEVLTPNKILMLFAAEKEFRKELMKRLSQRRTPQGQREVKPNGR